MNQPDPPQAGLAQADPWRGLRALTPARIALGRTGSSLPTAAHLDFQLAHARARDAVHQALVLAAMGDSLAQAGFRWVPVRSAAVDRSRYLQRPDLGRRLDTASRELLRRTVEHGETADAAFVLADGLSAVAVQRQAAAKLHYLMTEARRRKLSGVALKDEAGVLQG